MPRGRQYSASLTLEYIAQLIFELEFLAQQVSLKLDM